MKVEAKAFLDAFDDAESYNDVATATDLTVTAVKSRARAMRKRGIELKDFPRTYTRDWTELAAHQAAKKIYGGNGKVAGKVKRGGKKKPAKKARRAKKGGKK